MQAFFIRVYSNSVICFSLACKRAVFALSALIGLALLPGCGYQLLSESPEFALQPGLESLCYRLAPLTVNNRGSYVSQSAGGDLLLSVQLMKQPMEKHLGYRVLELAYRPAQGLEVTAFGTYGAVDREFIPGAQIECIPGAMLLTLPSDPFYVWATVGVKSNRLLLKTAANGSLILHNQWEEKGAGAVVMKVTGDAYANFPAGEFHRRDVVAPDVSVARRGECPDLAGAYDSVASAVTADGRILVRTAAEQFFRPEIMGDKVSEIDAKEPAKLGITHAGSGGLDLVLTLDSGTTITRQIPPQRLTCEQGRWLVRGEKEYMPIWMLATGSVGARWENLLLSRDVEGALIVDGVIRGRGTLMLIPTGYTGNMFMRFPLMTPGG